MQFTQIIFCEILNQFCQNYKWSVIAWVPLSVAGETFFRYQPVLFIFNAIFPSLSHFAPPPSVLVVSKYVPSFPSAFVVWYSLSHIFPFSIACTWISVDSHSSSNAVKILASASRVCDCDSLTFVKSRFIPCKKLIKHLRLLRNYNV